MRCKAEQQGFTLIEVLMALTIFSLIAVLAYGALGIAGNGFRSLSEVRDSLESAGWTARQLRSDTAYLVAPSQQQQQQNAQIPASSYTPVTQQPPLRINNDNRGDSEYDQLWLLVREAGQSGISSVHYFIDEQTGHLIRESRLLWARDHIESIRWDMGEAVSFSVLMLSQDGRWLQEWPSQGVFVWPRALKVKLRASGEAADHEWLLPMQYGVTL